MLRKNFFLFYKTLARLIKKKKRRQKLSNLGMKEGIPLPHLQKLKGL